MSEEVFLRGLCALLFSGMLAWCTFVRDAGDDPERQRYLSFIPGALLPACLLTLVVCGVVSLGGEATAELTLGFCFGVFLHICLYYLLLMPALPLLRRHISARACAVLWMIPNYLYLTQMSYMRLPQPRWVVSVPSGALWGLAAVWLAGFLAVLGGKIASHLLFRARILRDAVPVSDPAALEVWQREVENARFKKPKFRLVTSPAVSTPLSVGLFRRWTRVVLPRRDYTPEELALIFRHELIHIGREDASNKFFLTFCTAMCWFNPLMWAAMKRSAEDLELSCDETALLDAGEDTRRQYAGLLLKTAGDERGFTTCLSASAQALRYRLKNVVAPRRKHSGALTVGLVFFLLCMSCGYVALAYGEETGAAYIYHAQFPEEVTLRSIEWEGDPYGTQVVCTDEAALHRYLASLRMEHIAGNYAYSTQGKVLSLLLDTPEGTLSVRVSDRFVKLVPLYGEIRAEYYYLPDGPEWEALEACTVECPALVVHVTGPGDQFGHDIHASLGRLSPADGGAALYEMDERETPSGIFGYPASRAELSFSLPLEGDGTVEIVPAGGGDSRTVALEGQSMVLTVSEPSARYIVRGRFLGRDGRIWQAEFRFEIGS